VGETDPVPDLVERLRAGDAGAADALVDRYAARLTRVADQHLSRKLAGRVDGEDVVQSVFRTFFRRSAEGTIRIDGSGPLWRLLVRITLLKARAKGRHHTAAIRDVAAEAADPGGGWLSEAAGREPGPEDAATLVDLIEALLRGLPPFYCHLLELRLQGFGPSEIAPKLGVSRQTVHRALSLLQRRLEGGSAAPG
jgi:RNA polymerase sigma-70 factor, ECF subfamily